MMKINDYYNMSEYSEEEIYNHFKDNLSWHNLVLYVRIQELIQVFPFPLNTIYKWCYIIIHRSKWEFPQEYADMVNKWEQ